MVTLVPTGNGFAAFTQQPWRLRSDTCEELRVFSSSSMISAEATKGIRAERRRSTDMITPLRGTGSNERSAGQFRTKRNFDTRHESVTGRKHQAARALFRTDLLHPLARPDANYPRVALRTLGLGIDAH